MNWKKALINHVFWHHIRCSLVNVYIEFPTIANNHRGWEAKPLTGPIQSIGDLVVGLGGTDSGYSRKGETNVQPS
jgi:hypothetical protein